MTILALGPFRLDTQGELLLLGSEPVALGRRAIALLRVLAERPGALVSKDALIEAAWPGQIVEDSNLTVQIAALRRALGKVPGGDLWVETMPRRGYRFVGEVAAEAAGGLIAAEAAGGLIAAEAARGLIAAEAARGLIAAEAARGLIAGRDRHQHAEAAGDAAERRQVTALSCELCPVPGLAAEPGLEDLREAAVAFRRCLSDTVGADGGFVVRRPGNQGLVLFGYPAAHEHDAERAVRSALRLCAAVSALRFGAALSMACRAGIATGMVIVGDPPDRADLGGDGAHRDQEIVGDPPDRAWQLRLSVPPGGVAIDPATRTLINNLFNCQDLGSIGTVHGGGAVRAWQVLAETGTVNRFEAMRGPNLTRLVGRDEELGLMLRRWNRARAGDGQVVLVGGEAGIGKSRLVSELEANLQAECGHWLRYFCSPNDQDSALLPFADHLRRAARFGEDDSPAARLAKLEALLARRGAADDVALLADLLSLRVAGGDAADCDAPAAFSAQSRKQRTLEALTRYLEGLAHQQPVVMIVEDAHWIDPTSRELLEIIVERVRGLPVLLIVTFRPEFQPPWIGQSQVTMLALNRLDRRERISLAAQVAGKTLPDAIMDQIADRTDGVPLFIEELTKTVLESGLLRIEGDRYVLEGALPPFAVPSTLYASLLARLDRPATVRLVAQTGAAIGRVFGYGLLHAVCPLSEEALQAALGRLVASELVFQRGIPPDSVYSFKHALVQDVAYGGLLRGVRQQLHARIAGALEAHSPGLVESQPELLAQHYSGAGMVEAAVAAWARAGHRSAARSALAEAAVQFQKALDQLALLPGKPGRLRQELELCSALGAVLRFVKGQAAPETGEAYARTARLWEALGSPPEFRQVAYGQAMYHVYRGELDRAQRVGAQLLLLSGQRDDSAGLVLGHSAVGQSLLLAGWFAASQPHLEALLGIYDPALHGTLVLQTGSHPLMTQSFLGLALFCLGFPDQAMARSRAAITDARRLGHPTSLAVSLAIGCLQVSLLEDFAALGLLAEALTVVATEQGLPFYRAWGDIFRGRARVGNGDMADGMSLLRQGVAAYRATGAEMWLPHFIALLAAGFEAAGELDAAMSAVDDALRIVGRTGEQWYAAELNRHRGRLQLRRGLVADAERSFTEALGIARAQQATTWALRAAASLARLGLDQGRHAEARHLLASIHGRFTEGFDTADLRHAKTLLDNMQAIDAEAVAPAMGEAGATGGMLSGVGAGNADRPVTG